MKQVYTIKRVAHQTVCLLCVMVGCGLLIYYLHPLEFVVCCNFSITMLFIFVHILLSLLYLEGMSFGADGLNNGAIQGKRSVSQESFGFPHLTSSVKVTSVKRNSNQPKINRLNKSLQELNIGLQQMPTFQPHHSSNTMHIPGLNSARLSFQSFENNEEGKLKFELQTSNVT